MVGKKIFLQKKFFFFFRLKKKAKNEEKQEKNMCYLNDFNNTNTLFSLTIEKMDKIPKNWISNIMYRYGIEKNSENFNELAMVIKPTRICYMQRNFYTFRKL